MTSAVYRRLVAMEPLDPARDFSQGIRYHDNGWEREEDSMRKLNIHLVFGVLQVDRIGSR